MRGSIPASATPDAAFRAAEPRLLPRRAILLRRFLRTPTAVVGLVLTLAVVVLGLLAGAIAPGDPFAPTGRPLVAPSRAHLMGSDDLGRDLFDGIVHGARTSMLVVLAVLLMAAPIGVTVGAVSGYQGGLVDDVLMRVTELFQAMPRFFLAIVAVALFGAGLDNLIMVLGLTSWPLLARVVRAETLSVREREFVDAARSLGASEVTILVRHVLPNVLPPAFVVISLTGASVILLEASVGFLGLGDPDVMSWGYLANNSQRFLRTAWWMSVFPGAAIVVAVLGFNLLSDGLNDVFNPFVTRATAPGLGPRPGNEHGAGGVGDPALTRRPGLGPRPGNEHGARAVGAPALARRPGLGPRSGNEHGAGGADPALATASGVGPGRERL